MMNPTQISSSKSRRWEKQLKNNNNNKPFWLISVSSNSEFSTYFLKKKTIIITIDFWQFRIPPKQLEIYENIHEKKQLQLSATII